MSEDITVVEARQALIVLEDLITMAFNNFTDKTGMQIRAVEVERRKNRVETGFVYGGYTVRLDVGLKGD